MNNDFLLIYTNSQVQKFHIVTFASWNFRSLNFHSLKLHKVKP